MSWLEVVLLFVAGTAAGTINAVVGSGSLITFPTLVALGYPPVLANVTNNIGVLPGSISAVFSYRREMKGQWRAILPLAICSAVGGLTGALLLLVLPASAFDEIVPVLILLACVLVIAGPWLKRVSAARQAKAQRESAPGERATLLTGTALTGVYGGYFGAAQGVILLALLSILVRGGMQRANAYKNVLAGVANGAAAVVFVFSTPVAWLAALIIAVGAILGGQIGGSVGHRLPPVVYRVIIVAIGIAAIIYFYVK
jgi:uncharacterized membrane protein YfcA